MRFFEKLLLKHFINCTNSHRFGVVTLDKEVFTLQNVMSMNKLISAKEAVSLVKEGTTIMIGGFLANGTPPKIIDALVESGVKNLTLICNDTAFPDRGVGRLIANRQVARLITSHIGTNPHSGEQLNSGELEIEFCPQGSLVERIRAGGAGLGGILTATGLGTIVAEGKEVIEVDGKPYLLEKPLRADIAFVGAGLGDRSGNLVYRGTSQNFNPVMATAADVVVAEITELVEVGEIAAEHIKTQAIFIDYIVH